MKVALIGDVHANLPALEAVLTQAHAQGVEAIWNVGDWVGYGAFPNEVVALLRREGALSIIGNYDLKALEIRQEPERKVKRSEKLLAFRWTYDQLTKENRKYLRALSREVRLEVEGKRILLTHGSPESNTEHLGPETPDERLRELAAMARADVVVCGHSHRPFARKVGGVWFINTGSVGRPDDGDPRACYAILWLGPRFFRVRHYRVEYDVERAVAAIREHKLPEAFAQMVLQGRSLDDLQPLGEEVDSAPRTEYPGKIADPPSAPVESTPRPAAVGGDSAETEIVRPPAARDMEADLQAVQRLSLLHSGGDDHPQQVTRLALRLFDELQPLHGLGARERFWLECAALLHDIGWAEGWKAHHKTSLRMVLEDPTLPFARYERLVIGSIARYHRRALPSPAHAHYAALKPRDQGKVSVLAALLRIADGLDCSHEGAVADLTAEVTPAEIVLHLQVRGEVEDECQDARGKGDLLEQLFGRALQVLT
jgi:putative phosphoesterase